MRRSRLVLVLCLVCAPLVRAAPADADVAVTVTPDSDLSSGDAVTLTASGLTPHDSMFVCEVIIELGPGTQSCGAPAFVSSADGNGSFTGTYSVRRFVTAQLLGQVDCAVVACGIGVLDISGCCAGGPMGIAPITFRPGPVPRPDAILKRRTVQGELVGDNVYEDPASSQNFGHAISPNGTWTFALRMQNDGEAADDLRVGFAGADFNGFTWSVSYSVGYFDVTALVNGPGLVFQDVPVGETRKLAVHFSAGAEAPGHWAHVSVRVSSGAAPELTDVVRVGVLAQ
jgi:Neocarzinostatin family